MNLDYYLQMYGQKVLPIYDTVDLMCAMHTHTHSNHHVLFSIICDAYVSMKAIIIFFFHLEIISPFYVHHKFIRVLVWCLVAHIYQTKYFQQVRFGEKIIWMLRLLLVLVFRLAMLSSSLKSLKYYVRVHRLYTNHFFFSFL